jgi:hypothetical protein
VSWAYVYCTYVDGRLPPVRCEAGTGSNVFLAVPTKTNVALGFAFLERVDATGGAVLWAATSERVSRQPAEVPSAGYSTK